MDQRCNSRTHKRGIAVNKQALSLAVFVAGGAYPAVSNALSLGDIESNSNLNQPLKAQIELLSTSAQEAQQLQVRLAPPSVFNRVGIDRPAYLENLRFSTTVRNGKPMIVVSSDTPIDEPFVNFLVEVSWPQGQLLKEYTVMLDPPVLMQPGSTTASEATVRAEPGGSGRVARPAPQPVTRVAQRPAPAPVQRERPAPQAVEEQQVPPPAQAQAQPQARPARRAQPNRTYRVRSGDTLYNIAARARPRDLTVDQMMVALYRANPNAFIRNNINGLKRGSVLKAPSMELAQGTTPNGARQQVRQHYNDWKEFRTRAAGSTAPQERVAKPERTTTKNNKPETVNKTPAPATTTAVPTPEPTNTKPKLEVLGGNQQPVPSTNATAAAGQARLQELENQLSLTRESISARQRENAELRSRLTDLQSMVDKKNKIVEVSSNAAAGLTGTTEPVPVPVNPVGTTPAVGGTTTLPGANPGMGGMQPPVSTGGGTGTTLPPTQMAGVPTPTPQPVGGMAPNPVTSITPGGTVLPPTNVGTEIAGSLDPTQGGTKVIRTDPSVQTAATPPIVKPKVQVPLPEPEQPEEDLLSMLTSPLALQIGAGSILGLLGLGLLWRFLRRKKNKVVNNDAVFDLEDDIADPAKGHNVHGADVFANLEDDIKHAEQQRPDLPIREAAVSTAAAVAPKATVKKSEPVLEVKHTAPSEEEDDVLMESNVYIAYGLHQQAESELKKAIEKHPERMEYRHKLLENYFAANNRAGFDQTAQEFMAHNGANKERLWNDIVAWGRKISPDNPLYATGSVSANAFNEGTSTLAKTAATVGGAAAATAGTVAVASAALKAGDDDDDFDDYDLDLPDLDLPKTQTNFGNDPLGASAKAAEIKLDKPVEKTTQPANSTSEASYSAPTINQDDELDDFDFDLDFDEPKVTKAASTPSTKETRTTTSSMLDELDSLDFDTDPVPTPKTTTPATPDTGLVNLFDELDLGLDKATDKVADTAKAAGNKISSAATNTMDSLEMGLDTLTSKAGGAAAAVAAGAGAVAAGVLGSGAKVTQPAEPQLEELDDLDDSDFSALDDLLKEHNLTLAGSNANTATPSTAAAPTATDDAAKVTNLALHIKDNDLNKILPENNFYTKSGSSAASVAPVSTPAAKPQEDEWLGDIDDALSFLDLPDEEIDLHEAHISTKLDLARAYLDMGDIEGARSTLEEVVVEGNDDQRREAQQLLHQAG